jgi:uncharacterized membrane protein
LLANQEVYYIGGEPRCMVYLPTAPVPMTGGLVLVPADAVIPVPEMKVDDLLRVYFSLGALAPDILPRILKKAKDPERALKVPTLEPADPQYIPQKDAAE